MAHMKLLTLWCSRQVRTDLGKSFSLISLHVMHIVTQYLMNSSIRLFYTSHTYFHVIAYSFCINILYHYPINVQDIKNEPYILSINLIGAFDFFFLRFFIRKCFSTYYSPQGHSSTSIKDWVKTIVCQALL